MRLIHSPVKRSKIYEATLQKLGGKDATLFSTLREALTFCAVLGYKERRKLPLDPNAGTEDIAGAQYQINEAVDIIFALALADSKTSDILRPEREKDCIQIYEEYANGGLDMLASWIDRFADLDVDDAVWQGLGSIGIKPPERSEPLSDIIAPIF
jgi:dnd system-associated protein 4